MISLEIPAPPSVNRIWRKGLAQNIYKNALYQDWLGHAGWVLRSQNPGSIAGRVVILISIEHIKTADIDNRIKALFDLLVLEKVIENDNLVVGFAAAWAPAANKMARLLIMPAASFACQFLLSANGAAGGWFIDAPDEDEYGNFPEEPAENDG